MALIYLLLFLFDKMKIKENLIFVKHTGNLTGFIHLRDTDINIFPANKSPKFNVIAWLHFGNLRKLLSANIDVT